MSTRLDKTVAASAYSGIITLEPEVSEDLAVPSFFRGTATVTRTITLEAPRNDAFAILEIKFDGISYTYVNNGSVLHAYNFGDFWYRIPFGSALVGNVTNGTTSAATLVVIGAAITRVGRTITVTVTYSQGGANCTVPAHTIRVRGRFFRLPF